MKKSKTCIFYTAANGRHVVQLLERCAQHDHSSLKWSKLIVPGEARVQYVTLFMRHSVQLNWTVFTDLCPDVLSLNISPYFRAMRVWHIAHQVVLAGGELSVVGRTSRIIAPHRSFDVHSFPR